ncbi:MAG: PRC-barrel domain-containing protein [Anaerolineales bacterium]|nr:PRC-barrel domain-containing protein [Anaerolineales bacterium]
MFLSIKNLSNYKIEATDGSIGQVHSFLFDDQSWIVRYLVVDTGTWLPGRKVLITPSALGKPEGRMEVFPVELTRDQIKDSPDIDTEKPVSRQLEIELHKYYGWAPYWGAGYGAVVTPIVPPAKSDKEKAEDLEQQVDQHLRSTKEVIGYHIQATDDEIGHVEDFIVHEDDWTLRYMVVDTKNWLPGKKVIIPPHWIKKISWGDSEVIVEVARETVKGSPEFDPAEPVNREYETRLYDYYGRPKYWI